MQYNDDARLDTSEVQDTRGGGMGFGRVAAGGGGLGIVGLIVVVLMNVLGGGGSSGGLPGGIGGLSDVGQGSNASSVDNTQFSSECKTGADANTKSDCAIVADIDSVQAFWNQELPALGRATPEPTRSSSAARPTPGAGAPTPG